MGRLLYLHEVVDIVGENAVPYMEKSVLGFKTDSTADRGLDLYGTRGLPFHALGLRARLHGAWRALREE